MLCGDWTKLSFSYQESRMIKNKILSKEILLLEPSDDHTHAHAHTNVMLCCGTVHDSVLHWCSLFDSVMFNHIFSTSRLHIAGSDHNVHPSTANINILLKVPEKTSFFQEPINILWRTWFSCWNATSCYILRWIIKSNELTVHLQLGFSGLTLETNINKKGRRDNAKKSSVCQHTSQNNTRGFL